MSKTDKKIKGFREFLEDDDNNKPNPKKKPLRENKGKTHQKLQQKLRNFDPKNFSDEDFDEFEDEWSNK
jgi:hypothetical protein